MHIIFEHIRVDVDEGQSFSEACKELFPKENSEYVDGIYRDGVARLRPAYARKLDREKNALYGSLFYYYVCTVDNDGKMGHHDWDTVTILRNTSL